MQPLLAWLQEDVVDTWRSVFALFKATLDLKSDSGAKQCSAIVGVMRYIMRNGVQNRFREETALLTNHFDQTLSRSYTSTKKNEVPLEMWWSSHKQVAPLVVSVADFVACMVCKSSWTEVEQQRPSSAGRWPR